MHVDQSGHDDVVQLVDHRVRRVLSLHLLGNECCGNEDHLGRQAVDNLLSIDDDGVEVIDRVLGNDGNNPSRVDNQTHRSHARSDSLFLLKDLGHGTIRRDRARKILLVFWKEWGSKHSVSYY